MESLIQNLIEGIMKGLILCLIRCLIRRKNESLMEEGRYLFIRGKLP
ncbi:MAG: hypothetical protein ABIK97_06775 [candidate division WOR-3 bacterium]